MTAVLACGCTTGGPAGTNATTLSGISGSTNLTPVLLPLMLGLSDLPEGYTVDSEYPTRSADKLPAEVASGYLGGYFFSAMSYDGNETVAHTVLVYSETERPKDLDGFFRATHPVIANWTITPLADPKVGSASTAWSFFPPGRFVPGETLSNGYVVIFEKGPLVEIVKVTGPKMNESTCISLARTAASKTG
jgi:hypothetical protein